MDIMLNRILTLIGTEHGSAQKLVKAIGASKNAVTEWKSGRSCSYTKYAPQIADYYGVSLDWLSGLTDEKEKPSAVCSLFCGNGHILIDNRCLTLDGRMG